MTEIGPYEGEVRNKETSGRESIQWDRDKYLEHVGKLIYGDLNPRDPANFKELYRRAYATFQHNQGKLITIEDRVPTPSEKLEEVTLNELIDLEVDVSIFFGGGLGVLCKALGRDPQQQWEQDKRREEGEI